MHLEELLYRLDVGEDQETECKSCANGFPKSLWETLSAFANTEGGHIVLGASERRGRLEISGVRNPNELLKTFWDTHNNTQKLSFPICSNSDVRVMKVQGHQIVIIRVPRALRTQRPVYINENPMTGSYKRNSEGDYHCSFEEVRQMLRDASDEPQDIQILEGFSLDDLDMEALKSFRQRFGSREPDHPFLAFNDRELLCRLGGWHRERRTGIEGLTLAGLLMFGRERSILETLPYYQLDYQEQLSDDPEKRWTYRLTLDGKWEPNLFNFYYRVYGRLVTDLEVPFQLDKDAVRRGETHVHEALREALVNTLIHADHRSTRPIKIIKRSNAFTFSNPGCLRIPLNRLYEGGVSDPRNPNLQKMFQMLGLGEKAGSGFQKILRAWQEQQWLIPLVSEQLDLELTSVTLPTVSFIPENVERELREVVGDAYPSLTELDRIVLVLAHQFEEISNANIQRFCSEHPREIGECLKRLVANDWLKRSGHGRGSRYALIGSGQQHLFSLSSEHFELSSEHSELSSEHSELNSEQFAYLQKIAAPVREKGRVDRAFAEQVILELCSEHYLQLRTLAELLGRSSDSIRNHYIKPMLSSGLLELRYPHQQNHPQQAYRVTLPTN